CRPGACTTGAELERSGARTTGAELELSDARTTGPSWTRRRWLPSWRAHHWGRAGAIRRGRPGPSWMRRRWLLSWRAPRSRAGCGDDGCRPGARHRAEVELLDVGATGPSWSCPTWAPRLELGAAPLP